MRNTGKIFSVLLAIGILGLLLYFNVIDIPFLSDAMDRRSAGYSSADSNASRDAGNEAAKNNLLTDMSKLSLAAANADEALDSLNRIGTMLEFPDEQTLSIHHETAVGDTIYYRYDQYLNGTRVYGKSLVAAAKNGRISVLSGNLLTKSDLANLDAVDTNMPEITEEKAEEAAVRAELSNRDSGTEETGDAPVTENTALVYFETEGHELKLAYRVCTAEHEYLVDAKSGDIMAVSENVRYDTLDVRGKKINGSMAADHLEGQLGKCGVDVFCGDNQKYYLSDLNRKIYSWDKNRWADYDIISYYPEGSLQNQSAVDAYYNVTRAYNFYADVLKCVGPDGKGDAEILVVNGGRGLMNKARSSTDRDQKAAKIEIIQTLFNKYTLAADLDVIVHEYTHSVIKFACGLGEEGRKNSQADAINEGIADIMGELAQDYYDGSAVWRNKARNIASPEGSLLSSYSDYKDGRTECHNGSGIISHAAWLMWTGDEGHDPIHDYKTMSELWYRTINLMTPAESFRYLRAHCAVAARNMYVEGKLTKSQMDCVSWVFSQVGIPADVVLSEPEPELTEAPGPSSAPSLTPSPSPEPSDDWKQAYISYLQQVADSHSQDWHEFFTALININGDDIPELYIGATLYSVTYEPDWPGAVLCSYRNGHLVRQKLEGDLYTEDDADAPEKKYYTVGAGAFSYIEGQGLFCVSREYEPGSLNRVEPWTCYDTVYSMQNDSVSVIASGESEMDPFDQYGTHYNYVWNHQSVSQTEYEQRLQEAYDSSHSVTIEETTGWKGYEDMIDAIRAYPS